MARGAQHDVAEKLDDGVSQRLTDTIIVERFAAALQPYKNGALTEDGRREYLTLLAAVAPRRVKERDQGGEQRRVWKRLGVRRGRRSLKSDGGRQFATDRAVDIREKFDAAVAAAATSFSVTSARRS